MGFAPTRHPAKARGEAGMSAYLRIVGAQSALRRRDRADKVSTVRFRRRSKALLTNKGHRYSASPCGSSAYRERIEAAAINLARKKGLRGNVSAGLA